VEIKEEKFVSWLSEGKLDKHEQIKFYIIEWALGLVKDEA